MGKCIRLTIDEKLALNDMARDYAKLLEATGRPGLTSIELRAIRKARGR